MKVTINQVVEYKGHTVKQNGFVSLSLFALYGEITNSMKLLQLIGENVTLKAKFPGEKPFMVGNFSINGINFAKDGKSTIKLVSLSSAVNMNVLEDMIEQERINVQYSGEIEGDDDEGSED